MVNVCFNILMELVVKKKVTCKYLAEKYEVSIRTVLRYLDVISSAGVNFFTTKGRYGGVQLADNFRLTSTYFTSEEKAQLSEALTIWQKTTPDSGDSLKNKILALNCDTENKPLQMIGETLYIEGGLMGDAENLKDKLLPIRNAILNFKLIQIEYHSRNGEITLRVIEPHAFVLKDMIWYVYAFCRMRNKFRMFKINRITKLLVLGKTFDRHNTDEFTPWQLEDTANYEKVDLLMKVNESARYFIEEWLGVDSVKEVDDNDWPYLASGFVFKNDNLISKLISFGGNVKVLSPAEIRIEMKNVVNNIMKTL